MLRGPFFRGHSVVSNIGFSILHCVAKKEDVKLMVVTVSVLNWFSKFFHCRLISRFAVKWLLKILPTTSQTYCYTTVWNINVSKTLQSRYWRCGRFSSISLLQIFWYRIFRTISRVFLKKIQVAAYIAVRLMCRRFQKATHNTLHATACLD